jgi:hypothetical protein
LSADNERWSTRATSDRSSVYPFPCASFPHSCSLGLCGTRSWRVVCSALLCSAPLRIPDGLTNGPAARRYFAPLAARPQSSEAACGHTARLFSSLLLPSSLAAASASASASASAEEKRNRRHGTNRHSTQGRAVGAGTRGVVTGERGGEMCLPLAVVPALRVHWAGSVLPSRCRAAHGSHPLHSDRSATAVAAAVLLDTFCCPLVPSTAVALGLN